MRVVEEGGGRVIVPVEGIAFDRVNERNADTHVLVAEEEFLITLVHFPCLLLPQTVDDFVFIQQESLPDIVRRNAGIVERSKLRSVVFVCQQSLSCRIEEVDTTCCGVHFHLDGIAAQCHIFPLFTERNRGLFRCFGDDEAFLVGSRFA